MVRVHRVTRPDLPGENNLVQGIKYGFVTMLILWIRLKIAVVTDVLVVHKPLPTDLVEVLFDVPFPERTLTGFDPVVYATFDANYVHTPEKSGTLFERADLVYATSRRIYARATEHAPSERVALIPPSIDTDRFRPDPPVESRFDDDGFVLGWVGSIEAHDANMRHLADTLGPVAMDDVTLRLVYNGGRFPDDLARRFRETGATVSRASASSGRSWPTV